MDKTLISPLRMSGKPLTPTLTLALTTLSLTTEKMDTPSAIVTHMIELLILVIVVGIFGYAHHIADDGEAYWMWHTN